MTATAQAEPTTRQVDQDPVTEPDRDFPVNPYARRVAFLRVVFVNRVGDADLQAVADRLIELAKSGNLQAIKLLLSYTLGKPTLAVHPDRLDIDEWDIVKQTAPMFAEMSTLITTPDPDFPLSMLRASRPAIADELGRKFVAEVREREAADLKAELRRAKRQQARQAKAQAPPANGPHTREGPQAVPPDPPQR